LTILQAKGYIVGSIAACSRCVVACYNVAWRNKSSAGSGNIVSKAPFSAFPLRNFEPTCPFGHGISNPTPYQARRPPLGMRFTLKHNINVAFVFFFLIVAAVVDGVAALTLRRCNATIAALQQLFILYIKEF